jgi:hypothetical protein
MDWKTRGVEWWRGFFGEEQSAVPEEEGRCVSADPIRVVLPAPVPEIQELEQRKSVDELLSMLRF